MTTPDNPYGDPGQNPPPPPAYGSPQYGAPAGGAPAPYGQAPYGQAPYGAAPAGNFGGTLADWPIRVGATLIDGLIIGLPAIILAVIAVAAKAPAVAILIYIVAIGFGIWNLLRQGKTGQTLGKKQCGIYVVREADGQYTGGGMAIVRAIAHIVDGIPCYIGYLWPLWDAKKQTFADKIMGTVVVKR